MEMNCTFYKDTKFGKADLVWNIPEPGYDFTYHESFDKVINIPNPFQLDNLVVEMETGATALDYDYLRVSHSFGGYSPVWYFIDNIRYERNIMVMSLTIDILTTNYVFYRPIAGTLIRRHVTESEDSRFGFPTALNIDANFTNELYDVVKYTEGQTKFVESTINLKTIAPAKELTTASGATMVIPVLPEPGHVTSYGITSWSGNVTNDYTNAYTLYLFDLLDKTVLNTVRGLSGDGAISDSYMLPSEAVTTTAVGSELTRVVSRFLTKTTSLKLEIDYSKFGNVLFTPRNKAVGGMFKVAITSLQEKTRIEFPAWDLRDSVDANNFIKFNLWCDPKPSGAPYCCPDQVETIFPSVNGGINNLATLEVKSVKGGQWLRNPLIYNSGKGELFSTVETQLAREKADYEKQVSMHQLNMSQKEREIRIAQNDYQFESGLASSIIGSGMSLLNKDFSGAFSQGKGAFDSVVNQKYVEQLRDLQVYEHNMEKKLINMAYSNNLKNLNVQETIRRIVPREVAYGKNESMGSYDQYNSFMVSLIVPDIESLKAKDLEYTLYGYPVYETVENFYIYNSGNFRRTHTVFQFENPVTMFTGIIGETIKQVLQSGIRIIHRPFTPENILNN